jgi:hypothetical protein
MQIKFGNAKVIFHTGTAKISTVNPIFGQE